MRERGGRLTHAAVVSLVLLVVSILPMCMWLGDAPLAGTEGHRALTAHQMRLTHEYMLPMLYGEVYLRKPPMMYWVIALFEEALGGGEYVWRLPSVLGAGLTVIVVWLFAWRWFGRFAGLVSGLSMVSLVAVWSQSRSADIDCLNTLATTVSALTLIEIGYGPSRRKWPWMLLLVSAVGSTLLLKGPAGLPVLIGVVVAALGLLLWQEVVFALARPLCSKDTLRAFADALLPVSFWKHRQYWRVLRSPHTWLGLSGGAGLFVLWAILAAARRDELGMNSDMTGVGEVAANIAPSGLKGILAAAALAPTLFAYALPHSTACVFALLPGKTSHVQTKRHLRARVLTGSFVAALCVFALVLMSKANPRYGYVALPLLCPLIGYVAHRWRRGEFSDRVVKALRQACTVAAIMLAGLAIGTAWVAKDLGFQSPTILYVLLGAAIAGGIYAVLMWVRQNVARGATSLVVLTVVASLSFSAFHERRRDERSFRAEWTTLEQFAGGDSVHAENIALDFPEIPYYADVYVTRYPQGIGAALEGDQPRKLLLTHRELAGLTPEQRALIAEPIPLAEDSPVLFVRYLGGGAVTSTDHR